MVLDKTGTLTEGQPSVVAHTFPLPNLHFPLSKLGAGPSPTEREFFIDNLLVGIHFIIVMIRWNGLAPWEFESFVFQVALHLSSPQLLLCETRFTLYSSSRVHPDPISGDVFCVGEGRCSTVPMCLRKRISLLP